MHRTFTLLALTTAISLLALAFAPARASAQQPTIPDSLKVDYFAYANTAGAPDGTVRLSNPGTTGGNVCAAIFVFNADQEVQACCSCLLTPDGLLTLSVNDDLTTNPLTGVTLISGSFSIISTATVNGSCPLPTTLNPISGGVRSWSTHIEQLRFKATKRYSGTVAPSQDATLSATEESTLATDCYDIYVAGSGHGFCTCGTGD
jgi:hypothetical protein